MSCFRSVVGGDLPLAYIIEAVAIDAAILRLVGNTDEAENVYVN